MDRTFRLYDFNIYNEKTEANSSSDEEGRGETCACPPSSKDSAKFMIQMFGKNEHGESCSILAEGFKPFFYVKVDDSWSSANKTSFVAFVKNKLGKYYEQSLCECKLIKRRKLYGFDGGKEHKFLAFKFDNIQAFNKAKNLWYNSVDRKLLKDGLLYGGTRTYLYEANIPPLLRLFHIRDISPSGWVALPNKNTTNVISKKTTCDFEVKINYKFIIPLNDKETRVPLKICSFDIEASSSHGDFPVPIKSYKKLATNIIEYFENRGVDFTAEQYKDILRKIVLCAFGYEDTMKTAIDKVYPKKAPASEEELKTLIEKWLVAQVRSGQSTDEIKDQLSIEALFEKMNQDEDDDVHFGSHYFKTSSKKGTVVELLMDKKMDRTAKMTELNISINSFFPRLEGDKVTFIGSTFLRSGEKDPYLNHCVVLNTCSKVENAEVESYSTEKALLLAWRDIIQKENPDIIIGYNIFGFDYEFMFRRAEENNCVEEFLKLSKNKSEVCGSRDFKTNKFKIEETSIRIASGEHDLKYIKMNGRIQIDLFNFFRREENLTSYKLDYVAGHFIGDYVKTLDYSETDGTTTIQTANMTGLLTGSYIHFEEIGHSIDYYNNGEKFVVLEVLKQEGKFKIGAKICPDQSKKVRWCLAKDDVTPKDIFTMTNGTADDRAVIAKYCIQDCNLVHYLMNKVDILTGFVEMAKICSVPINFLVLRGQGIKLTSYVAKKCREKRTLMPVMEKSEDEDGFEGAIVLDPKCDLYLDNPVACVDYASLYPSSMMSENISHDSKVWTLEYDLDGQLVCETGEKNAEGAFIYDNLPGYEYVNITYDTFMYVRKTPSAAAEKVKCGHKICRFAQPLNGARAIMPSILEELLMARKTTRKLIPAEKDEFMKNVLDKRQIGYKLTANSLYGQCGAKTSSFYDKDCAASTTATGRLLLTYAKKVVEECYGNAICETANYGPVLTKAEYIYGDSVANYTPTYIRVNEQINICTIEQLSEKYGENNWVKCTEEGKQEKEFCELQGVETWTEKGWTKLHRVIRHELAPHKKMIRILTHTGLVDVTDDHSLIAKDGKELSPKDATIGTELLHHRLETTVGMFSSIGTDDECVNKMYKFNLNNDKNHLLYAKICAMIQSYSTSKLYINLSNETNNNYNLDVLFTDSYNDNKIIHLEEIEYQGYVYDLTTDNHHFAAGIGNIIVHNTDSVFFTFNLATPEGKPIRGKDALEITIELAQQAGHLASKFLKAPHDLEYEKTFMPFCLLSKKRYVGMLYETDPTKCKRKEMGIVLKRRDNAPIVKEIYGGIIDILMKEQDIGKAVDFLRSSLRNIVDEKYPIDKLIISKSLRSGYKNPKQIAHKVLADRIMLRDPGNKPGSGDRIPYVFVHNSDKKAKQGERIETPTYIKEKGLKIDYSYYITNQIMKPTQQVFALVLEKMWTMQNKMSKLSKFKREVDALRIKTKPEKFDEKLDDLKEKEVKALLFDEFLRETNNQKENNQALTGFFKLKK
jgi:DNA polymerase elongation subunit (family B)